MTHIEISDLIVEYVKRHPDVTVGELCQDNDVMFFDLKLKICNIHSSDNYTQFSVTGQFGIDIHYGKIHSFCNDCSLQESKIALLKVLVDGREDLI